MLDSAAKQSESVKLYIYPLPPGPPYPPSPYPTPLGHHRAELPVLHCRFPLAIYILRGSVCMSILISHFAPLSQSSSMSRCPFSMLVSIAALEIGSPASLF